MKTVQDFYEPIETVISSIKKSDPLRASRYSKLLDSWRGIMSDIAGYYHGIQSSEDQDIMEILLDVDMLIKMATSYEKYRKRFWAEVEQNNDFDLFREHIKA